MDLEMLIPASTPEVMWITRDTDSILTSLGIKSEPDTHPGMAEPYEIFYWPGVSCIILSV